MNEKKLFIVWIIVSRGLCSLYKFRTNNTVNNIFNKESKSVIIFEIGIESVGIAGKK